MHTLIVGRSQSGKSALAKTLGSQLRADGHFVVAYNPTGEKGYTRRDEFGCAGADIEFDDPDRFEEYLSKKAESNSSEPIFVIVDEAHEMFPTHGRERNWIATKGRHFGFNIIAITQRGAQVSPTLRSQCTRIYLFPCSLTDARFMADEYGNKKLSRANELPALHYYRIDKSGLAKGRL